MRSYGFMNRDCVQRSCFGICGCHCERGGRDEVDCEVVMLRDAVCEIVAGGQIRKN